MVAFVNASHFSNTDRVSCNQFKKRSFHTKFPIGHLHYVIDLQSKKQSNGYKVGHPLRLMPSLAMCLHSIFITSEIQKVIHYFCKPCACNLELYSSKQKIKGVQLKINTFSQQKTTCMVNGITILHVMNFSVNQRIESLKWLHRCRPSI